MEQSKSFIVACKEFFGFQPGQTLMQFKDEVNQLTQKDKEEIAEGLSKELGMKINLPAANS